MDDIKQNSEVNPVDEENYEDISGVTIENNTISSFISTLIAVNPILGSLLSIYHSGIAEQILDNVAEAAKLQAEFQNLVKTVQREEAKTWNTISRDPSQTSVMVYIYNGTAETFNLASCSWDLSGSVRKDYEIAPWQYMSFILRSEPPERSGGRIFRSTQVKHSFTYKSGELAFNFLTLLKLTKPYEPFSIKPPIVPSREHTVRSIGKSPVTCSSTITRATSEKPYSYGVVINLS